MSESCKVGVYGLLMTGCWSYAPNGAKIGGVHFSTNIWHLRRQGRTSPTCQLPTLNCKLFSLSL